VSILLKLLQLAWLADNSDKSLVRVFHDTRLLQQVATLFQSFVMELLSGTIIMETFSTAHHVILIPRLKSAVLQHILKLGSFISDLGQEWSTPVLGDLIGATPLPQLKRLQ
jgi:hypothetical protein